MSWEIVQADHASVAQEQADAAARTAANAAAGGGVARSLHKVTTTGIGNGQALTHLKFAVTFVGAPLLTTGVEMISHAIDVRALPLCTVGVFSYDRDSRGLYAGAWVWAVVTYMQGFPIPSDVLDMLGHMVLDHHLCFEGPAIRDVNYDAIMDDG